MSRTTKPLNAGAYHGGDGDGTEGFPPRRRARTVVWLPPEPEPLVVHHGGLDHAELGAGGAETVRRPRRRRLRRRGRSGPLLLPFGAAARAGPRLRGPPLRRRRPWDHPRLPRRLHRDGPGGA